MTSFLDPVFNSIDSFFAWVSASLKQTTESYCDLETADDEHTLVAYDGSLVTLIEFNGITHLIGVEEFKTLHRSLCNALQNNLKRSGHALQVFFSYDRDTVINQISDMLKPAENTARRLELDLGDLFAERKNYLSQYCAEEKIFFALWTRPDTLSAEQFKRASKTKLKELRKSKMPPITNAQNLMASIPELRDEHNSFVRAVQNDLDAMKVDSRTLEVHEAVREIRMTVDSDFTDLGWRPVLPGDKIPVRDLKKSAGAVSDIMWPPLGKQIIPRDAENVDLRTCRIGDRIYSSVFIDLFPQEVHAFNKLFRRAIASRVPWRISYFVESDGLKGLTFKSTLASILSFTSRYNRLISDAANLLRNIEVNSDDAVVRLRVVLTTWAPEGQISLLRSRAAELAKAVQGWGNCETSEKCGDAFEGVLSSALAVNMSPASTISVAPLSQVIYMLPFTRPASAWKAGAVMLRSPDGKPWPYQPGSSQQTTWIDLTYARPGSGKSVFSNSINLGLCLAPGIQALPRIAIIDIGPSSSGLISLLREALPRKDRHMVAYHRLEMAPSYSINPFDTQLGCRKPTATERSFLVNFLTLLATPLGAIKPYDGMSDMVGLIVDELYEYFSDDKSARVYTSGVDDVIDGVLQEIGFVSDEHTTWWEVTDALFIAGFSHESMIAQRYAMPLMADAASICRSQPIEDLYGNVRTPTDETLVGAFSRMISSAVREYPILSRVTQFDLGEARVVAMDLDEVAKSGGDAADRQTAVMYMLARYVLAKNYYLTEESIAQMPKAYQSYHLTRVSEIKESPKRIVYDEFHRTSKSQAVRDQVIVDMREGRKWNVQVSLISQSLEDFGSVMVEFATSVFIMDAGPEQAVQKSAQVFGLSETAITALRDRVHGPREGGATFLAQFSTKHGSNTQLLTNTIGPIELWAFSTTAEDASLRNKLYKQVGPAVARRMLARYYPNGSVRDLVEARLAELQEEKGLIEEVSALSIIDQLLEEVMARYQADSAFQAELASK
ncbi:MAG: type IV secretion protein IcmB [Gammaproteobacteria bacterium CG11_big_fil_rev_8_21_14_0_20_46_22]|nr:MAG: type IV secretion protein IcmB [Gammaproteobacteria bacterium CG12_big_fil_rev_8_21_14_0_65_46_12]PIR10540.1 MAG: type IV secretion protein IcmB [Gammaproteobacteria bacterium CG11_big_fil_rev_8_21_14_0_20_46_22]